jgi:D-serine deaminase-like pyridoxal phosphate-dependent protein
MRQHISAKCSELCISHMKTPPYQLYRSIFDGRQMPYAFVDMELLTENGAAIARRAQGKSVRIASKSIRITAVLRQILGMHSSFNGVMCYSAAEANHLSRHGFDDLLVAYPVWRRPMIEAVCHQLQAGKTIVLMVDSPDHIEHLGAIAAANDVVLPVCLDIDLSMDLPGIHFGVWRSPVKTVEAALQLYSMIEAEPHLRFEGIMGYEAQIAGVGDKNVGLASGIIKALKRRSIPLLRERRLAIVDALKSRGANLRIVNGGGTGSLETTSQEDCVTEVTAGSGFYAPSLFDHYSEFQHQPAAGYAIEIIRRPKPGIYTCYSGGYVASGEAGKGKLPKPYLPVGAALTGREGAGEVQTPIIYQGSESLSLGDPIFMRHAKAGELFEHFNTTYLISGGKIVDEVPTYRGEGCAFG